MFFLALRSSAYTMLFLTSSLAVHSQISVISPWTSTYNQHTTASGSNRLLLYVAAYESNPASDLTAVSYGGQNMTLAIQRADASGFNRVEIWYLNEAGIAVASGNTFTATFDNGLPYGSAYNTYAVTLGGVDQTSPFCQTESGLASNTTSVAIANTLNLLASELSVYAVSLGHSNAIEPHSGYTELFEDIDGVALGDQSASVNQRFVATTGDETVSASSLVSTNRLVIAAVRILPNGASCAAPLPVELVSFEAKANNEHYVEVNWTTASEVRTSGFHVERSLTGSDWETLHFERAASDGNQPTAYSFKDLSPYHGLSYYRLAQLDDDGQVNYSDVKSVLLGKTRSGDMRISPNPSKGVFELKGSDSDLSVIQVFNILGQQIDLTSQNYALTAGVRQIDLSAYPNGIYYVKTRSSSTIVVKN